VDVLAGDGITTHYEGNVLALVAGTYVYLYSYNLGYGSYCNQSRGQLLSGAIPFVSTTNLGPDPLTLGRWYTVSQRFRTGPPGSDSNFGWPIELFVRANSHGTTWSAFDNARLNAAPVLLGIRSAKAAPNDSPVTVSGVVTASFNEFCYIELPDRSGGIRVNSNPASVTVGHTVTVEGNVYTTGSGERYIVPTKITDS
jgi:hypothetical protein